MGIVTDDKFYRLWSKFRDSVQYIGQDPNVPRTPPREKSDLEYLNESSEKLLHAAFEQNNLALKHYCESFLIRYDLVAENPGHQRVLPPLDPEFEKNLRSLSSGTPMKGEQFVEFIKQIRDFLKIRVELEKKTREKEKPEPSNLNIV